MQLGKAWVRPKGPCVLTSPSWIQIHCIFLNYGSFIFISGRNVTIVRKGWRRHPAAVCSAPMDVVPLPTTLPVPRLLECSCSRINGHLWSMLLAVDTKVLLRLRWGTTENLIISFLLYRWGGGGIDFEHRHTIYLDTIIQSSPWI